MRIVLIFWILWPLWAHGESTVADNNPLVTRVKRSRAKKAEPQNHLRSNVNQQTPAMSSVSTMELVPGIAINQQGGPLAPSDMKIRGLSGARLSIDLEGMNLVDSVSGFMDVNDLPLFANPDLELALGTNDTALAGKLSLRFPVHEKPFTISRAGFGSQKTGRFEMIGDSRLSENLNIFWATQALTTAGNFLFSPTSVVTNSSSALRSERINNDQHHWVGLFKLSENFGQLKGATFLFAKIHEGGIPGLALAPLPSLRGSHKYVAGIQNVTGVVQDLVLNFQCQARLDERETWQRSFLFSNSKVGFASTRLSLSATGQYGNISPITYTLTALGELTGLLNDPIQRQGGGLNLKFKNQLPWLASLTSQIAAGFYAVSDAGFLPHAQFNVSIKPDEDWLLGARVSYGARAPTFLELYAPTGFVLGNPNLRPEKNQDVEIFGQWSLNSLQIKLSGFYGFLQDGIFYFNRNAYEIAPVNTDTVHRVGAESQVNFTPENWFSLEGNLQMLLTQLSMTKKPLPNIPWLSSSILLRLGDAKKVSGWLKAHYRSQTTANVFGTLTSPAYLLFDAFLKIPFRKDINFHFSITNIFNNLYARDSNQLPLPGRTYFALLEFTS